MPAVVQERLSALDLGRGEAECPSTLPRVVARLCWRTAAWGHGPGHSQSSSPPGRRRRCRRPARARGCRGVTACLFEVLRVCGQRADFSTSSSGGWRGGVWSVAGAVWSARRSAARRNLIVATVVCATDVPCHPSFFKDLMRPSLEDRVSGALQRALELGEEISKRCLRLSLSTVSAVPASGLREGHSVLGMGFLPRVRRGATVLSTGATSDRKGSTVEAVSIQS